MKSPSETKSDFVGLLGGFNFILGRMLRISSERKRRFHRRKAISFSIPRRSLHFRLRLFLVQKNIFTDKLSRSILFFMPLCDTMYYV